MKNNEVIINIHLKRECDFYGKNIMTVFIYEGNQCALFIKKSFF